MVPGVSDVTRARSVTRAGAALLASVLTIAASLHPASAAQTSGLPSHFGFGLAAHPDESGIYGWMPESDVPWDYAYQYLAGGVNTNQGWETWNPNGTFASNYAHGAAQRDYIPMFPYYEIFQSRGPCDGCDENRRDLSNLNAPEVMNAYYRNFALLMKRLGPGTHDGVAGFGGTALVNVEPDLSGYAQQAVNNPSRCFGFCAGQGNDARLLKAAVSTSGMPDVAGYPDTYAGFNEALLHLRDLYAPNVLLGFDISPWATGQDIGLSTDPSLDGAALGRQVGEFARSSGGGTFDVLFSNPLDRDAGQYKAQFGQNRWWDRLNVRYPNFNRWQSYLGGAISTYGKPMLLWQVPMGNQYFQTMNNTPGHFQDNRAEYIFSHVDELRQIGIIGVMFGAGNAGNSSQDDGQKDGVTNPPAFCTTDGISTGQICNDHPSVHPDDDGGFIRMSAAAYYRAPVLLDLAVPAPAPALAPAPAPVVAPAPVPDEPFRVELGAGLAEPNLAVPGQAITLRQDATTSRDTSLLVDFEVYNAGGEKVWQTWQDNTPFSAGVPVATTVVFTLPETLAPGEYLVKSGIFSAGWGTVHAWNDRLASITVP
jgi:hypothetical protein